MQFRSVALVNSFSQNWLNSEFKKIQKFSKPTSDSGSPRKLLENNNEDYKLLKPLISASYIHVLKVNYLWYQFISQVFQVSSFHFPFSSLWICTWMFLHPSTDCSSSWSHNSKAPPPSLLSSIKAYHLRLLVLFFNL